MDKNKRIEYLRAEMEKNGVDYYLVHTSDFHGSEYVGDSFKVREYLSGFTGSNGTLVISRQEAGLWTDGRYFIQAGRELTGTGITLFRMGEPEVPTVLEYLKQNMKDGQILAFDGRCISARWGVNYENELHPLGIRIQYQQDLVVFWTDRPQLPAGKIWAQPEELAGQTVSDKITKIRQSMAKAGADYFLLTKLDDLMWLFNVRGGDIPCNPVALSYGMIGREEVFFFVQSKALDEEVRHQLTQARVTVCEYDEIADHIQNMKDTTVMLDMERCNYLLYKLAEQSAGIVDEDNPTELLKAVKNSAEIKYMREIYRKDSVALIRFIKWVKENAGRIPLTEISAGRYLDDLRRQIPEFIDFSFPTICAYEENAAMMHYEAKAETNREIAAQGMLLVDSGGQYQGGTTDVTRTIVLGEIGAEVRCHYTAAVRGMLTLSRAIFLKGCTGRNLDILARGPLWELGIDYKCGTGHGIGYMLNVHEGPQNIRWGKLGKEAVLLPGMVVSNEPGVYREGSHGIRIENIMLVRERQENTDGCFLEFETLTYVPIDRQALDPELMTNRELTWLNAYHQQVYETAGPLLNEEERVWLKEACAPLSVVNNLNG